MIGLSVGESCSVTGQLLNYCFVSLQLLKKIDSILKHVAMFKKSSYYFLCPVRFDKSMMENLNCQLRPQLVFLTINVP